MQNRVEKILYNAKTGPMTKTDTLKDQKCTRKSFHVVRLGVCCIFGGVCEG
jgi:hypothetical protein